MAALSVKFGRIHAIRATEDKAHGRKTVTLLCGPKVDVSAESQSRFYIINGEAEIGCLTCQDRIAEVVK